MKVNLVKDSGGKVVATYEKPAPGEPQIAPLLKPGQTVHEVDASDHYKRNLKAFYEQHSR